MQVPVPTFLSIPPSTPAYLRGIVEVPQMVQQIVAVQKARPIKEGLLEVLASAMASDGTVPLEALRKTFAHQDQYTVTLALMELRQEGLIEPAQCVCVLYHKSGFVLDIEFTPGYKLAQKALREIIFDATKLERGIL